MPLETASTIADLVSTNPVGASDTPAALDDHIRLIKTVLKADALVDADIGVNVAAYSHNHTGVYQTDADALALLNASGSAPVYACRAWVCFDGTGTTGVNQTIRASGNVASVYKNGTGDYTVTFSTAMQDGNYVMNGNAQFVSGSTVFVHQDYSHTPSASSIRLQVGNQGLTVKYDSSYVWLSFFR